MIDSISDILIAGADYIARHPHFKFTGREKPLQNLQEILLQKSNNCVILTGASGVGMTALVMGLQTEKDKPGTPPKLMNKPIYFLDTDKLFESGDTALINKKFADVRTRMASVPGSVLYIENMGNFIDSCSKIGCSNLMNGMLGDLKKGRYSSILETPYEDLAKVIKYNSEIKATYTLHDLKEPKGAELASIVEASVPSLVKHHGISVSKEATAMATFLATKHRTGALQAMPAGINSLLDRALSSYALKAHSEPFRLVALEAKLKDVNAALSGAVPEHLRGVSPEELQTRWKSFEAEIAQFKTAWESRQKELQLAFNLQKSAQQRIAKLEIRLDSLLQGEKKDGVQIGEGPEVTKTRDDIEIAQKALKDGSVKFDEITAIVNKELQLGEAHVLDTFSEITGIPVKKLTQSDRDKIMGLEDRLNGRVFDQTHAVKKVFNAVKNAAAGLSEEGKPRGSFLFLGPSGVGKTELVKAVCDDLFDDPNAMVRIDMSEYMEKNAGNKLIGPPPGFVGFEEGGVLTEAMQKKPIRVVLIDEIEKAHPDVLNLFLQAIDDGRLTDGKGVTVTFEDVYFFFTSNIGQNNFPDRNVDYQAAVDQSIIELKEAGVRNELLNRFGGKRNIIGFYPLEPETMEKIVRRELGKVNAKLEKSNMAIDITGDDIARIGRMLYNPSNGARSVPGFFNDEVRPQASDIILSTPGASGILEMKLNEAKRTMDFVALKPIGERKSGLKAETKQAAQLHPAFDTAASTPAPPSHG